MYVFLLSQLLMLYRKIMLGQKGWDNLCSLFVQTSMKAKAGVIEIDLQWLVDTVTSDMCFDNEYFFAYNSSELIKGVSAWLISMESCKLKKSIQHLCKRVILRLLLFFI